MKIQISGSVLKQNKMETKIKTGPERNNAKPEKKPIIAKSAIDLQRLKLEKLMENPEKPVPIPVPLKEKALPPPPEFNRNVMGSSAGAGSGEFHVYRHIRRREYSRQKLIGEKAEKETLNVQYQQKIEDNKRKAEEKTAKKRAKRLKKKQNMKMKQLLQKGANKDKADANKTKESSEESSSEEESGEDEGNE